MKVSLRASFAKQSLRLLRRFAPRNDTVLLLIFIVCLVSPAWPQPPSDISQTDSPFAELIRQLPSKLPAIPSDGIYHADHFVQMQNLGSDALVCRLHLFRHAQKTLDILTYIWNEDASGRFMMREAVKAAGRGVKVRIMIDTIGTPEDLPMAAYFATAHPNLEVKIYNPTSRRVLPSAFYIYRDLLFKFRKYNQRMHTKLIIVDGKIAITGGRNFGDEYYDVNDGHNFKDRDILVIGPMLEEMKQIFESFWNHERAVRAADLIDVKAAIPRLQSLDPEQRFYQWGNMFDEIDRKAGDAVYIRQRFVETAFRVNNVTLAADPPGKNRRKSLRGSRSRATRQLLSVIKEMRRSILLQSPYFVLDGNSIKSLHNLRQKHPGLDIAVSTNSLAATDSIYAYAYAFKRQKTYVYDLGVRIFETKPVRTELYTLKYDSVRAQRAVSLQDIEQTGYDPYLAQFGLKDGDYYGAEKEPHLSIHAKSFVIDDAIAWIGSTNLDSRSFRWNTEIGIVVRDEAFAQALKTDMLWDMAPVNSWAIGKKKKGNHFVRRLHEPLGSLMENLPAGDVWPFKYTSAFELKKGYEPVAMDDPAFYDHYQEVGSFPLVSPLAMSRWRLRVLKSMIGVVEPVL